MVLAVLTLVTAVAAVVVVVALPVLVDAAAVVALCGAHKSSLVAMSFDMNPSIISCQIVLNTVRVHNSQKIEIKSV